MKAPSPLWHAWGEGGWVRMQLFSEGRGEGSQPSLACMGRRHPLGGQQGRVPTQTICPSSLPPPSSVVTFSTRPERSYVVTQPPSLPPLPSFSPFPLRFEGQGLSVRG